MEGKLKVPWVRYRGQILDEGAILPPRKRGAKILIKFGRSGKGQFSGEVSSRRRKRKGFKELSGKGGREEKEVTVLKGKRREACIHGL